MLLPPAVEEKAKPGVSAEESKAQRLKRQQARFRDRGGAFVPSNSNPLVDILLARTVSGESPSKARPKKIPKRPSKARQASPVRKAGAVVVSEEEQPIAGSSKSKPTRKRKAKAVEPEASATTKPAAKRRGRPPKSKKGVPDQDSNADPPPTKTKSTGKQRNTHNAQSNLEGNKKQKARARSNPTKEVVEVLVSDDDQTLVEVPHKTKSGSKRIMQNEYNDETDAESPVRQRVIPPVDDTKTSCGKPTKRVKTKGVAVTEISGKNSAKDGEEKPRNEDSKTNAKKRLLPRDDDDDDDIVLPPAKKEKAAKSRGAMVDKLEFATRTTKGAKSSENSTTDGRKGKGKADSIQDAIAEDDDGQPSKQKKRKKEEDNYDKLTRKVVKFAETVLATSPTRSSRKLKENKQHKMQQIASKAGIEDEPDSPLKRIAKPPSRTKTAKGPPREVLERIKESAARHLRCADSEPDELDCI